MLFRVSDNLRGINEDISVKWADSSIILTPQPSGFSHFNEAFIAPVILNEAGAATEHSFNMNFSPNGSEQLLFCSICTGE